MFKSFSRFGSVAAVCVVVAACQSSDPAKVLNPDVTPATDSATGSQVVQGACPNVSLREGTAYFTTYAKGGENDPSKVIQQASIGETTRQCRTNGPDMIMTVQATGRVVGGPAGAPGPVTLPIRVVVIDGENTLYSELQKQTVELPAGNLNAQFLFTNTQVTFPVTSSTSAKVWVGFDPGPYNTP